MELLYVWIEDYNNIHHQGFNFSPKHRFHFEPNEKEGPVTGGTLTHEDINPNYPDRFFGDHISNITAIVGENGSGKSSLIKAIAADISGIKSIFVYKEDTSKIMRTNISGEIRKPNDIIRKELNPATLYYSPFVNANVNFCSSIHNNISSTHILAEALEDISKNKSSHQTSFLCYGLKNETGSYLPLYHAKEMYLQIQFIKTVQGAAKLMNFKLPESINVSIYNPKKITLQGNLREEDAKRLLTECLRAEIQRKNKEEADASGKPISKELEENISKADLTTLLKNYIFEDDASLLPLDIEDIAKQLQGKNAETLGSVIRVNINLSDFNLELAHEKDYYNEDNSHALCINDMKKWIYDIGIRLTWNDLSDGEATMLSLFARLWKKLQEEPNTYIILLDEFELGLHPQWQKEAILRLKKFFELINSNKLKHLILTSHSPFLVSDLPRENVIFLKAEKDEKDKPCCKVCEPENMERTFGANIHNLYRSSFFMQEGLMGEFAKDKIDGVIADLRAHKKITDKRKKEIRFIIEQIGEPLVREMLLKQYNQKFHFNIEDRIEALEKELVALKAKRDDSN